MPKLTIVRGLPGSGKSTYVNDVILFGEHHYEADMFFKSTIDGMYTFEPNFLSIAHDWCYSSVVKALKDGYNVYVSNTFTKMWEMEKYLAIPTLVPDVTVDIVTMKTQYENVHGVPEEKFKQMAARWEELSEELKQYVNVKEIV
jgi:hypothetical protein